MNYKIHYLSDNQVIDKSIIKQLNYLEYQLKEKNLGDRMQTLFPEGFVFINALYGLSWCEYSKNIDTSNEVRQRALNEAVYAYDQIKSGKGTDVFSSDLKPEYGIFYSGWKNYLLAKIISLEPDEKVFEIYKDEFKVNCDSIAKAFENSLSPFLQSYPGQAWPADAIVALTSLKLYDKSIEEKHTNVIENQLTKIKKRLDPETGLIPHFVNYSNPHQKDGARGCSATLMIRLLAEIDPAFAIQQFNIYKEKFLFSRIDLLAIREYPEGKSGSGDIDSGPVIFDIGFAATIVAIGTFRKYGDYQTANSIANNIEAFEFTTTFSKKKKYIFGLLPMADAFIAWSKSSIADKEIMEIKKAETVQITNKSYLFHLISFVLILLLFATAYWKKVLTLFKSLRRKA